MLAKIRKKIQWWIKNGCLIPYDEQEPGPSRELILLKAVVQQNKLKSLFLLGYKELNQHVDAFKDDDANVYTSKLREWHLQRSNVSLLGLRAAYLQVHTHKSLWLYQIIVFHSKRY